MRKAPLNSKGFGLVAVLLVVVVLAVIGGSGAYVYHKNHKAKASPSTTSTTQTGKTTKTPPKTTPDPYAGWKQYCSTQEKSCFKYPANWATKDVGAVDPAGDGLQLTSPNGTVIWFQSAVSGLGGACDPSTPHVYIHTVVAEPKVSGLYLVESGTQAAINHVGLVNATNGQQPQTGDTGSCIAATTFASHHDPSTYSWFESNGTNNFKLTDLSTAELILKSYTY